MSSNPAMHTEAFWLLCGKRLGAGVYREVYECLLLEDCVVKVESGSRNFSNQLEWEIWHEVKDTPFEKWFAPCVSISPNGSVLVQKRTSRPLAFPDKVPAFFTDLKQENYGWFNGHLVAHDYGNNLLFQTGLTKRMKKARWWSNTD